MFSSCLSSSTLNSPESDIDWEIETLFPFQAPVQVRITPTLRNCSAFQIVSPKSFICFGFPIISKSIDDVVSLDDPYVRGKLIINASFFSSSFFCIGMGSPDFFVLRLGNFQEEILLSGYKRNLSLPCLSLSDQPLYVSDERGTAFCYISIKRSILFSPRSKLEIYELHTTPNAQPKYVLSITPHREGILQNGCCMSAIPCNSDDRIDVSVVEFALGSEVGRLQLCRKHPFCSSGGWWKGGSIFSSFLHPPVSSASSRSTNTATGSCSDWRVEDGPSCVWMAGSIPEGRWRLTVAVASRVWLHVYSDKKI